ncbi:unnamed protein product [Miscanthus lutarioriparius]|uniref:Uncharacterized protein n=1 Tax=Miscanthus lutarioriparius TaxID=422564 RepID=A0A811P1P6_9POAL|nr:unnamed protein product [Miscanthus lutarioriparius]
MAPGAGRHDDGEFDHSQNDELRMCGMAGDDEDDDVREDAAVLFGRSAADPLPVDDSDPPVDLQGRRKESLDRSDRILIKRVNRVDKQAGLD